MRSSVSKDAVSLDLCRSGFTVAIIRAVSVAGRVLDMRIALPVSADPKQYCHGHKFKPLGLTKD